MNLNDLKDYDKKYIFLNEFKLEKEQRIELLLFLINFFKIPGKIEDYYLVLGGRGLISRHNFQNSDFFIQNARILLKTLNQKKVYLDELREYESSEYEKLYTRVGNKFIKVKNITEELAEREELYLKLLSLEIRYKLPKNEFAFQKGKRYGIIIDEKPIEIKLLDEIVPRKISKPRRKKRSRLKLSISDLIKEAQEIDETLSQEGNSYRKRVLENTTFKFVKQQSIQETKNIEINNITNKVGQVGSGKSTLSDAIVKKLAKENKKVVVIESSVPKVLKKAEELNRLGIDAIPVIGSSNWTDHINKVSDGKDFLSDFDSEILTSGCALGGLINEADLSIDYGKEPCTKIYKFYERGASRLNQLNINKTYQCPFYYSCPRRSIQARIFDANVIVTTTAALATMKIGISGMTLFQYTLEYVDLVIVDEAESELQKADQIFAPYVSIDDYIRNNGSISGEFYRKSSDERTSSNLNLRNFISLHQQSNDIFMKINDLLKNDKHGFPRSRLERPFSGRNLIRECWERNLLPEDLCKELEQMSNLNRNRRYIGILRDFISITNKNQLFENFSAYGWGTTKDLTRAQVNRVIFICSVLYFEHLYRELSNLVEKGTELPNSTKEILSQRFEFHQRYIPVSPIGNIFGLQYKDKEKNGKSDLCIVKQFATGRAMYLRFPWLKVDTNGNPLGPHVLLLSGSSFAPGSLSNHIDEHVNYIIEAEPYKRKFIEKSHFEYLNTGVYVSGSGEKRNERLRELVSECKEVIIEKLESNDNILMIVNSYEDVTVVYTKLREILSDTPFKEKIAYIAPDDDNSNDPGKVKQSKVTDVVFKDAKILVSVAVLIERGHNIVDEKGNAYFDTLMFMTRPMPRPDDYRSHVSKVNGYIMAKYSNRNEPVNTETFKQMRSDAFYMYNLLGQSEDRLDDLDTQVQKDIVVTLFVMILQIFGRLCRIGNQEDMKSKAPDVYFADAAFKAKNQNGFDLLNSLVDYLEEIMSEKGIDGEIAKTLYDPFYQALRKGRKIYDKLSLVY